MLVRAKWNVKDASGWHAAGDVFETENDLGDAVEILEKPEHTEEPVKEPEEEKKEPAKRTAPRRKKSE